MEICIIAPLKSSDPTYSIAGVIKSQAALLSNHRHKVSVIVNEDFSGPGIPGATLLKILPSSDLIDYKSKLNISKAHEDLADEIAVILSSRIPLCLRLLRMIIQICGGFIGFIHFHFPLKIGGI